MKTSHRRIALLTGASLSALGMVGIATPAFAAPHDDAAPGTYTGTSTSDNSAPVSQTITIGNIATADNPNPDEYFLGVKNEGTGGQVSTVNSYLTGQVRVQGGVVGQPANLAVINAATAYA
jgi:hypothetical protein